MNISVPPLKKPKAIFFDWDGTLVDSYAFLNDAHNHVLASLGFELLREGEYKQYFGMPREILYPAIYKHKTEEAKAKFEVYVFENSHKIRTINGAASLLGALHSQNVVLGVVSNKKATFIEREIAHLGWQDYFKAIVGAGEAAHDKPSGAPLKLAVQRAGLSCSSDEIWYIGDTENDMRCAREAQCHPVLIDGHDDPDALARKYNPILRAADCAALQEIFIAI